MLIGVGLLLLLYAAGMYADLVPGSRVSVPRPVALERRSLAEQAPAQAEASRVPAVVAEPASVSVATPIPASAGVDSVLEAPPLPDASSVRGGGAAVNEPLASASGSPAVPDVAAELPVSIVGAEALVERPQTIAEEAVAPLTFGAPAIADVPPGQAVKVSIPAIKLSTDVVRAGLVANADGELEWETVPFVAAHYVDTSYVGGLGNAVISGHVVTRREGNVFRNLYLIELGDTITAETAQSSFTYVVNDVKLVPPSAVEVMSPTPDATLTLITCGGEFDPTTRQFSDRLIVTAKLSDGARHATD